CASPEVPSVSGSRRLPLIPSKAAISAEVAAFGQGGADSVFLAASSPKVATLSEVAIFEAGPVALFGRPHHPCVFWVPGRPSCRGLLPSWLLARHRVLLEIPFASAALYTSVERTSPPFSRSWRNSSASRRSARSSFPAG